MLIMLDAQHQWQRERKPFGLSIEDTMIWKDYMLTREYPKSIIWCTVPVGVKDYDMPTNCPITKARWIYANQKKIDIVMESKDRITIIELRNHAGVEVIGTLQNYKRLFIQTYGSDKPIKLMLITNWLYHDTQKMAEAEGVEMRVIEKRELPPVPAGVLAEVNS
jgi:hypothetical protein